MDYIEHQHEFGGYATVTIDGVEHETVAVVSYSPLGIKTWLYVDKDTSELVLAERIDGEWYDLDLDEAREEFADVLYCY